MLKALTLIADDMKKVEDCFRDNTRSDVELVREVSDYILSSGGKRVRPLLLLLCARLAGYKGEDHIPLAAVVELIHTASLLHDDVVDGAEMRRGKAAANALWGNQEAVLVGDYLYSESYLMMVRIGNLRVLEILADATSRMSQGELVQLRNTCDLTLDEPRYLEVVRGKTAILIAGACQVGGILAEVEREQEEALREFGMLLGTAFQLLDDALDYVAQEEEFGKKRGQDLLEGKMTLPLIYALTQSMDTEKAEVERIISRKDLPDEDLEKVCQLIDRYQGVSYTRQRAQDMVNQAKDCLRHFPKGEASEALAELSDYVVLRTH